MTEDRIEREITVAAPVSRVWAVLTEAPHIAGWFGDTAEIDLRVGGTMVLGWKEHGTVLATVERVEPPHAFAYRWSSTVDTEPAPGNSTLVEFTLTADGDGTRLRVVESGFAALDIPVEEQRKRHAENTDGWRMELDELREYAER
jgi:uncharacterized protein YndB with AHSA1/START domain